MSVSLCMIVKNEEEALGRCLESVKDIADEMIIVDTGSQDATKKIAESYGAKIYDYKWNDSFADARNFSLSKAKGDWLLIMDADDEFVREDKEKLKTIILDPNASDVYYMHTLCFTGEAPDLNNTIMNLNVRLIRNGLGYRFEGNIHEHPVGGKQKAAVPVLTVDIRFYHYGYLRQAIDAKDKRNRNIIMIEKEIERNPDDPLMIFYLGNEYYAIQDFKTALRFFEQSLLISNPANTLVTKLLFRMAVCGQMLGNIDAAYGYIDKGLRLFPNFTDIEFLRAGLLFQQNRIEDTINSLNRCIKMGDPPPIINNLLGTGSFRPQQMLSEIYFNMGLYSKSYYHCQRSLAQGGITQPAMALIYRLLCIKLGDACEITKRLDKYAAPGGSEAYLMLSDIYYNQKQYDTALLFLEKAEPHEIDGRNAAKIAYYRGRCYFNKRLFSEAHKCFVAAKAGGFESKAAFFSAVCDYLEGKKAPRKGAIKDEYYDVLLKFHSLAAGEKCTPLSEGVEASERYIEPILSLLDILIKTERFDDFGKALGLLNLIDSNRVLLLLAKTYYNNKCFKSAWSEFIRSIKITGNVDAEALDMMKSLLPAASA